MRNVASGRTDDTDPAVPHGDAPRGSRPQRRAIAVVVFVLGVLLTAAWRQEAVRREASEGRRDELAALVAVRERRAATLNREMEALRAELEALSARSRSGALQELRERIITLRTAAGLERMRGPGLVVELADSPLATRGDAGSMDFLIQDVDLQGVVNELWSAGAEAVSVNGERIVATTAIRSAGGAVLVNYRVLTSPYRVTAIGDPERMRRAFESSAVARRFKRWTEVYRLGFRIEQPSRVTVPAYGGGLGFRYARAARAGEGEAG